MNLTYLSFDLKQFSSYSTLETPVLVFKNHIIFVTSLFFFEEKRTYLMVSIQKQKLQFCFCSALHAGKTNDLVPIVSEQYGKYGVKYYAVAVVRKETKDLNINTLEGKKSCHTGARRTAGWNVPIGYLLRTEKLPAVACGNENNDFLSVAKFFNASCVPGKFV